MVTWGAFSPLWLVVWLFVVPLLVGLLFSFVLERERRRIFTLWLCGLFVCFLVFEPISLFCMVTLVYSSFTYLTDIYVTVLAVLCLLGVVRSVVLLRGKWGQGSRALFLELFPGHAPQQMADLFHPRRERARINRRYSRSEKAYAVVFLVLLLAQMFLAVYLAPFDGDDAYYVVESLQSQQTDTIYTLQPYLGYSTSLDYRHATAHYPIWIAFIGRVCGIHTTILSHTVLPLVWIPLSYCVYACCGRVILKNRKDLLYLFLCFLCALTIWGNVSIYTPETFFLMRTWQGKSMVGNLSLPLLFFGMLLLAGSERDAAWKEATLRSRLHPWLVIFAGAASAGFFSTSGIMMAALGVMLGTVAASLAGGFGSWRHKLGSLGLACLCCVPGIAQAAFGFMLR